MKKAPGNKVHFFSNTGTGTVPVVLRTRLHYKYGLDVDTVRASLLLVEADHKTDPYFRWCDVNSGTISEIIKYMK